MGCPIAQSPSLLVVDWRPNICSSGRRPIIRTFTELAAFFRERKKRKFTAWTWTCNSLFSSVLHSSRINFVDDHTKKSLSTTRAKYIYIFKTNNLFERNVVGQASNEFFLNKNPNLHMWGLKARWLGYTSTSQTKWARLTAYKFLFLENFRLWKNLWSMNMVCASWI
jgi:hypothetical protein